MAFWLKIAGKVEGPLGPAQLALRKDLTAQTWVSTDPERSGWRRLEEFPELAKALAGSGIPPKAAPLVARLARFRDALGRTLSDLEALTARTPDSCVQPELFRHQIREAGTLFRELQDAAERTVQELLGACQGLEAELAANAAQTDELAERLEKSGPWRLQELERRCEALGHEGERACQENALLQRRLKDSEMAEQTLAAERSHLAEQTRLIERQRVELAGLLEQTRQDLSLLQARQQEEARRALALQQELDSGRLRLQEAEAELKRGEMRGLSAARLLEEERATLHEENALLKRRAEEAAARAEELERGLVARTEAAASLAKEGQALKTALVRKEARIETLEADLAAGERARAKAAAFGRLAPPAEAPWPAAATLAQPPAGLGPPPSPPAAQTPDPVAAFEKTELLGRIERGVRSVESLLRERRDPVAPPATSGGRRMSSLSPLLPWLLWAAGVGGLGWHLFTRLPGPAPRSAEPIAPPRLEPQQARREPAPDAEARPPAPAAEESAEAVPPETGAARTAPSPAPERAPARLPGF